MPAIRSVAENFLNLPKAEIQKLMKSKIHEERMLGIIIVTDNYKDSVDSEKDKKDWF